MTKTRLIGVGGILLLLVLVFAAGWVVAKTGMGAAVDPASLGDLERAFTERMRNVSMVGYFTVAGREEPRTTPDRYDISSVEKVGDDQWRFNARIGEHDVTLPVTVTMRWIGDTPIIMLTDLTIPTLGTFSVRLLFYGDRYAGTWQHGDTGGHMYGRIEPQGAGT
jgi:hypothetical protein